MATSSTKRRFIVLIAVCFAMCITLSCSAKKGENTTANNTTYEKDGSDTSEKEKSTKKSNEGISNFEQGKTLSDFTMETNKGTDFVLSKTDKPVFINIWATWCGFCITEMPDLQSLYEEYHDKVDFLMVDSGESKKIVQDFLIESGGKYTFPVGYDESGDFSLKGGVVGFPTTLVVAKDKTISDYFIGARQKNIYKAAIDKVLDEE